MLLAEGLGYRVGGRTLLQGVSFALEAGEVLAVLGPNGAGKTTLLRLLSGEEPPSEGRVELAGRPLRGYSALELALARAVLTQRRELSFPYSAYEVAFLGRLPHLERRPEAPLDHAQTERALAETQALSLAPRLYPTLSGGEQSRVDLARVLAQEPRLLLLDEPTNHLDPKHQVEVMALCRRLAEGGLGVAVVLHDLNLASLFADRILLLHQGRMVALGHPAEVLHPERLEAVYGLPFALAQHPSGRPWVMPLAQSPAERGFALQSGPFPHLDKAKGVSNP
ncbi:MULTISPECIES: heme ABC transporter ATP-binding protein [unclassified Meiothermus]|uniref:heme ABC transporter ATP-binding protein n=1 Tax=unclassified Meiothermus TaxID=370471 RepID=UPI000D7C63FF|nr:MULTISPECIES: heme ABC transporter ATP-binding protein [unclassified Meiothermus]PZA06372.1 heme ABC transporter ATP-binding protein [Meiothermus sp. Pnk-1]RYM35271.1 heme ABC transporter ATP-binding protein [Meiothermus sp. PNK-Is4]